MGLLCNTTKPGDAGPAPEILNIRTHQFLKTPDNKGWVFSRDCLEVDVGIDGKVLTLYVNHFKSMLEGKAETEPRRVMQVQAVIDIVTERFPDPGAADWVILGDFNDYDPSAALDLLRTKAWAVDAMARIPEADRWTHFYDPTTQKTNLPPDYRQLDHIWLSRALADRNPDRIPVIVRDGLCTKATRYTGHRFAGVTQTIAASDHCPVVMGLVV